MESNRLEMLKQIADALAAQFGPNCEVVIHDLSSQNAEHPIVYIVNGHVTGRKVGDGPSKVVMEHILGGDEDPRDHLAYLTRTPDGKILKSTSIYIRDDNGEVAAIFCINFDISALTMFDRALGELISPKDTQQKEPERITLNVTDLLDDLIRQSVELVGKPVAMMNKDDKVKAIQFLNKNGALLITKSGDKIAKHFGISKYTLYSYLDVKTGGDKK